MNILDRGYSLAVSLLLVMSAVVLTGCEHSGGIEQPIVPVMVGPEKALVMLSPGSFEAVTLVERNYANAIAQQMVLRTHALTPGENYIKVTYWGPTASEYKMREQLPYTAFRQSQLAHEIRAEFPSTPMATSPDYLQNDYGAFSYAIGKGFGNDLCFFGWQQIRAPEDQRSMLGNSGMIQVRIRLCDTGASQSSLLSIMYHYSLTGRFDSFAWNPYGAPPPLDQSIGNPGQPTYPVAGQAALDKPAAARPAPMTAAKPHTSKRVQPTQVQPEAPAITQQRATLSGASMPNIPAPPLPAAGGAPVTAPTKTGAGVSTDKPVKRVVIPSPACGGAQTSIPCE
ncbi:cellulose biosynthesis protein BcsN [Rhizobium sp.]|uniref:cellulose biosynthesis protein BcsN n=1 Tax=Rhizobium sp. TaxID=391 RepID=UPI002AA651C5